jgi:hypothetical protein
MIMVSRDNIFRPAHGIQGKIADELGQKKRKKMIV